MKNFIEPWASAQSNAGLQIHFIVTILFLASASVFGQSTRDAPGVTTYRLGVRIAPYLDPRFSERKELQFPTDLDNFFNVIANAFEAPDLCGHVNPMSLGNWSKTLQSDCYANLAMKLHDAKLCDHVKRATGIEWDAPKLTPGYCRSHLFGPVIVIPDPHHMEPFVQFVRQTGFGDAEVAEFVYKHNPYHNPVYNTYARLRKNPVFLSRVQAGASYDEEESAGLLRMANPLEYLYQMLAVDARDPTLCARISPNARTSRNSFLRSACVWDIAVDQHDASLCEKVLEPRTIAGVQPYASRKDCYVEVSAIQGSGGLTYGPEFFPRPSWFRDALRQIGDEADADSVPGPSANDYWDFIQDLAWRGDPAVRAAFLNRVRALK